MALPTARPHGPATPPEAVPYQLTADAFYQMIDSGIIPANSRVGLWEGRLYEKMAKKQAHAVSGNKLIMALVPVIPAGWFLGSENPITLANDKAPLPDLAILRGRPDDYRSRRPDASNVALVIEVADTSLRKDTGPMLESHARSRIPVYWVINLRSREIWVYEGPGIDADRGWYAKVEVYRAGQAIPLILGGQEVARVPVNAILPEESA